MPHLCARVCVCVCACVCVCVCVCVCLDSILISQIYSQVLGNQFSNMVREMESHSKNSQIHSTPNVPTHASTPSSYSIPTPFTPTPPSQLPPSTRSCTTANSPSASSERTTVALWLWPKEGPLWTKPLVPLLPTPQPYHPGPQPPIRGEPHPLSLLLYNTDHTPCILVFHYA